MRAAQNLRVASSNSSFFEGETSRNDDIQQQTLINNLFSSNNFLQEEKALEQIMKSSSNESLLKSLSTTKNTHDFTLLHSFLVYFFNRLFTPSSATLTTGGATATSAAITPTAAQNRYDILVSSLTVLTFPPPAAAAAVEEDSKCYDQLKRYFLDLEWDNKSLSILVDVLESVVDPRLRQHALNFSFQIISSSQMNASEQQQVIRFFLTGLTDVWSAIRKDTGASLKKLITNITNTSATTSTCMPMECIEKLLETLITTALTEEKDDNAWKSKEGALIGLTTILRCFQVDKLSSSSSSSSSKIMSSKETYVFTIGNHHGLTHLPRCVLTQLKPLLYQCLKHIQLTVREQATNCLLCYIDLSAEASRVVIFQEIISKLHLSSSPSSAVLLNQPSTSLQVLDAAEAEGLLDALGRIATRLPIHFLLKHWQMIFPTIERYVMHIASTVRQKSSTVVNSLANLCLTTTTNESDSDSDAYLLLFQQMLFSFASHSRSSNMEEEKEKKEKVGKQQQQQIVWQQMEGRMLSIEILLKCLGIDFLSKLDSNLLRQSSTCIRKKEFHSKDLILIPETTPSMYYRYTWANDQALHATWLLMDSKKEQEQVDTTSTSSMATINIPMVQKLQKILEEKKVLKSFLHQTFQCFQSSQFELTRIANQTLPSLVRLFMWTNDGQGLIDWYEEIKTDMMNRIEKEQDNYSVDKIKGRFTVFMWTSVKYLLLHVRFLQEFLVSHELTNVKQNSIQSKIELTKKIIWNVLVQLMEETKALSSLTQEDVKHFLVVKVDVFFMTNIVFYQEKKDTLKMSSSLLMSMLIQASNLLYQQIPKTFQQQQQQDNSKPTVINSSSLDRALCICVVRMLPNLVLLNEGFKTIHSSTIRWKLLRVALSWFCAEDSLRWITVDVVDAQCYLLDAIQLFLLNRKTGTEEEEEEAEVYQLVLHHLTQQFPRIQQQSSSSSNTNVFNKLLSILSLLWTFSVQTKRENTLGLQIVQTLMSTLIGPIATSTESDSESTKQKPKVQSSWDDWDDEDNEEEAGRAKEDNKKMQSTSKSQKEIVVVEEEQEEEEGEVAEVTEEQEEDDDVDAIDLEAIHDIFIHYQQQKLQELRNSHFASLSLKVPLKPAFTSTSDSSESPQVSLIKRTLQQLKQKDQEVFQRISASIQLKGSSSSAKWTQLLSEL